MTEQSDIPEIEKSKMDIESSNLKKKIDSGEDVYILDVRTKEEYRSWRISYDKYKDPPLIPIDELLSSASSEELAIQIPKDKEIITVCSHGNRSAIAARHLSQLGYSNIKSLRGGMSEWNRVYDIAPIPLATKDSPVRIWQVRRISKGCMSYVIAPSSYSSFTSTTGNTATVIDPQCDTDQSIMKVARENNLLIDKVIDTHLHADHVSGLARLAKETGAQPYISSLEGYYIRKNNKDDNETKILDPIPIPDGDIIEVTKGVYLSIIHTPGHTDGSICLALKTGEGKTYLFTGDTLFLDGIGRPDLRNNAEEFANNLYNSYHDKLLELPDDTVILTSHINNNSITLRHEEAVCETLGVIKKKNSRLLSMSRNDFVKSILETVPKNKPVNYRKIIDINKEVAPCNEIGAMGDIEDGPNFSAIPSL